MLDGFKKFLLRGNVVDLAVAVVIGVAFAALVDSLVRGFINPVIAMIFGKPDLSDVATFTINEAHFSIGLILNGLINFGLVAAAVYFFVVLPMNVLMERFKTEPDVATPTKDCPQCLSSIPQPAIRCAFCTAKIG